MEKENYIKLEYKSNKNYNFPENLKDKEISIIKMYDMNFNTLEKVLEAFKEEILRIESFQESKKLS